MRIESRYHGLCSYETGLEIQEQALERLRLGEADAILLGFEHEPVVTLGVRGRIEDDLVVSHERAEELGVRVVQSARGGQATVHSPGQLVVYPCLNLRSFELSPRCFVSKMESITLSVFRELGETMVETGSSEPGLFIDGSKVGAFGFHIRRGFTSHGIAMNIRNDLSLFDLIRTCGVAKQKVARASTSEALEGVFSRWTKSFGTEFNTPKSFSTCR